MTIIKPLGLIIGVDPGTSMGILALKLHNTYAERIHFLQTDVSTAVNWLESTLRASDESPESILIACERYTVTPETGKRTQQPTALQAIGSVKIFAERFNARLVMQPPADAKKLATNEMLKRLDFYTTPNEVNLPDANDVNDAGRHATLALARFKASIFDAMLANSGV